MKTNWISLPAKTSSTLPLAVHNICEATSEMIQKDLDSCLNNSDAFFRDMGGLSLSSETIAIEAVNHETHSKKTISIPKMLIAGVFEPGTYIDVIRENSVGTTVCSRGSMTRAIWY